MGRRPIRSAAVVGWTGRGKLEDLKTSVKGVLAAAGVRASTDESGTALVVKGPEPASIASVLGKTPGIAWLAVGGACGSIGELVVASRWLASRYVRVGTRFRVDATGEGGVASSDVAGATASAVLERVGGSRVDEVNPNVVFRAGLGGAGGFLGVELGRGPGGTPTGSKEAVCLVSGGLHSSVLSWMALLSGYRVKMIHARVNDESVLAVARLYSELSHRVVPSALALEVGEGSEPSESLAWYARSNNRRVFIGSHSGCSEVPRSLSSWARAPLYLAQEEWFRSESAGLGRYHEGELQEWRSGTTAPALRRQFGGARAEVSEVLDGLTGLPPSKRR